MDRSLPLVLTRVSCPTGLDTAPYKSICIVQVYPEIPTFYAQFNKDDEHPNWQKLDYVNLSDCLKYLEKI